MKKILVLLLIIVSVCAADAQINKPYFYQRGRELIIEGRYRDAIESLNILLHTEKDDYEGYFLRGVAKYNLDDLGGAVSDFSSAIKINEHYTAAYQYRAITHSRMGLYTESLEDFQRAISIRPSMPGLYYSRGVTYFLNQQFSQSITDFDQFLRLEPREPSGYINRGTSYLYLKDTTAALANYNRAIDVNPYHADGYMRRGLVFLMQGKYMQSLPDLDKTIELSPDAAVAYFYRAMAFSYMDKIMLALDDFDSSIRLDSTNSVTLFNRAILRSQIGDYNRAIEDYNKVSENNPNNVLVFFNRANVNVQIGAYRDAIEDYTRAIELYPDFANAYLYRSQIKNMLGDASGSRKDNQIAQAKIAEYRSKLNDSTFSIYADTSKRFNQIMALDADFGNENFSKVVGDAKKEVKLLPLFRLSLKKITKETKFNPTRYQNQRLEAFISSNKVADLELATTSAVRIDSVKMVDDKLGTNIHDWNEVFAKGVTQILLSQYTSAMNYFNFAVSERPSEPFAYINRAVAQAEMIDFIASLDGDYQNITIDSDPATRLKKSEKRVYDYTAAIADLEKAAQLMPELPHIYYNLGNLACYSGDLPGAIKYFTRAIELYPYFAEAYYNRGLVQIYLKDNKTGCMDMSKAGELGNMEAYKVVQKYCIK